MCLMSSRFFAIEGGTKMKKLLCLVVVLTGAVAYSSVLAGAYSSIVGLLSSFGTVSTLAYFALCVICVSALVVLRTKGGLPFGFFLIVLGGFFLGVASRSPSPSAEFHAGLGFTFFVVGSLLSKLDSRPPIWTACRRSRRGASAGVGQQKPLKQAFWGSQRLNEGVLRRAA